ncbi:MAG: DMT family transporter [Acetobacteraceae bacterium]
MDRRARGILLIVLSTVAFSSAGFFTRLIPLDAWTLLFWRGVFAAPLILAIIAIQERRRTLAALCAIGRPGLAVAACSTAATIFYLTALRHTSVADVAVILAAAPFVTAGLAWLWLGLPGAGTTLLASLAALAGVSIMVGGSAADGSLLGDLLAFGTTVCLAVMLLILRRHEATPMLPAACLSAALCPLVAWPFAAPFAVAPRTWLISSCSAQRSSAWGWCC